MKIDIHIPPTIALSDGLSSEIQLKTYAINDNKNEAEKVTTSWPKSMTKFLIQWMHGGGQAPKKIRVILILQSKQGIRLF